MTTHGLRRLPILALFLAGLAQGTASPPPAPAPTPALSETTDTETTADGTSRDEAIASALAAAVLKVQGKGVPPDLLSTMFLRSIRDERMVRMTTATDARLAATRISTAVAFVQDYQVQDSIRQEDGAWTARVKAKVVVPQARLARNREALHLAVLPFTFMQQEEGEVGGMAAQQAARQAEADIAGFQRAVSARLQSHPRVALHPVPAGKEANWESAADTPGQVDWAALQTQTGANRFITVQVEDFRLEAVKLKGNITTARLDGGFTLHYRLLRRDNGQPEVLRSGTFTVDTRNPWLRGLTMSDSNAPASPEQVRQRIARAHAKVAELFTNTLLNELVLPQVLAREGDQVLLQNGAAPLRKGDTLAVLGPDVAEPDSSTGLVNRLDGMRIAVLEVTSATPERISARIIKGNAFAVMPGSLMRRIGAGSTGTAAAAVPVEAEAGKEAAPAARQPTP
ncbi:MAG: hypothetical protein V4729_06460 [Pseudomonadota bacterium]